MGTYTIAIMDEEEKERNRFIDFFEDLFKVKEISFVSSINELIDFIKTEKVDAIAIDYKLKDHHSRFKENGDYFFKELIGRMHDFPSFVFTQDSERAKRESKLIKPRFIIDKEILHSRDQKETTEFKKEIIAEIKAYKNVLTKKIKRLKELEIKKKRNTLDEDLENEYLTLNNEISQALSGHKALPLKYFAKETNEKLDEIIDKTDQLIKEISKRK